MSLAREPATIRVLKPEHPFMASLPWSEIGKHGTFSGYSKTIAKPGSDVLAELKPAVEWDVAEYPDPCIIKFNDPGLIDVECPIDIGCPEPYIVLAATLMLPIYTAWRRTPVPG